ncbi:MAG: HIT family protein [Sphaerochaetaceae bacterium]
MTTEHETCVFCSLPNKGIVCENPMAVAVLDASPVTELHTLIIPRRHVVSYFDLDDDERSACHALLHKARAVLLQRDPSIDGFNIGINIGTAAGQTVAHCHIHLIPRRKGDVADPRGGVRHTIPGKGYYR